ncbi:MAG TPA: hypothetical protein VN663_14305 [Ramlibacter sp.]|nr:hypothetical protein [Ramlibacter sp.]
MKPRLLTLNAALVLALCACSAQPPAPYQPPPRVKIDPLPPDVAQKKDNRWCLTLLRTFSASEQVLRETCEITTTSSSATKPVVP